jgi:hypothetical protein
MDVKAGDVIEILSNKVDTPPRRGKVLEVIDERPAELRVEWDDGHESVIAHTLHERGMPILDRFKGAGCGYTKCGGRGGRCHPVCVDRAVRLPTGGILTPRRTKPAGCPDKATLADPWPSRPGEG